jgi:hypothetical protein
MSPYLALVPMLLFAQAVAASVPRPGLRLAPQVAACPSAAEVEAALAPILDRDPPSTQGWVLSYGRTAAADDVATDAGLWMVLADASGERLVERLLPAAPADCPALPGAMAAVVERALRTADWTGGEPLPVPPPEPPVVTAPRLPVVVAPPERPRLPRLVLGAGPMLGTSARASANLFVDARLRVAGPLCVRAGATVLSGSTSEGVNGGSARMTSRTFTLAPLLAWARTRVEWAAGLMVLLGYDQGSGLLAQAGSGGRTTLALGVATAVALSLSPRWRLGVGLEGARSVAGGDFFVQLDGQPTVVLAPPAWEGMAAVRLEFLPWP